VGFVIFFRIQNWKCSSDFLPAWRAAGIALNLRRGRDPSATRPSADLVSSQTMLSVLLINAVIIFYALTLGA